MPRTTKPSVHPFANDPMRFFRSVMVPTGLGVFKLGEVMADFQRERFEALASSLLALAKGEKPPIGKFWFECVKGNSKSSDLALCVLWLVAFARRPMLIQIGASDRDQADELRKAAKGILHNNPALAKRVEIQAWKIVCNAVPDMPASDAVAEIIPADIGGSHGGRPDLLILDELCHIEKWEFVENLLDNATKMPRGMVIVATNSGFTGTPAFKMREAALDSPAWFKQLINRPAPWIDPAEIEEAKSRNSPQRYRRLWEGVWSDQSGDAIEPDDIKAAVIHSGPMRRTPDEGTGWTWTAGLDLGIRRDHSALVILAAKAGLPTVRLAQCKWWIPKRGGEVDLMAIESAILEAHQRFYLNSVWFDPSQAILLAQRLRRQGVSMKEMTFTGANLNLMATALMGAFRDRLIELYPCDRLIKDIGRLVIVEQKNGGQKLEATRDADGHADTAIALSIVLPAALKLAHCGAGSASARPDGLRVVPESGKHGVYLERGPERIRAGIKRGIYRPKLDDGWR